MIPLGRRCVKTKRTVLVTQFFPPETGAPANRVGALATALADEGELVVVTPQPGYPHPRYYRAVESEEDRRCGYAIVRAGVFLPHAGGFLIRAIREMGMAIKLAFLAWKQRPDLLVASSPTMFLGPSCLAAARALKIPFVWDLRDITWGYAEEHPSQQGLHSSGAQLLAAVMKRTCRSADLLLVTNEGSRRRVERDGTRRDRVVVAPNGVNEDVLALLAKGRDGASGDGARLTVTYVGLVGYNQGLRTLLELAVLMPEVDVRVVGDGPEKEALSEEAIMSGVQNIEFVGFLDRNRVVAEYHRADILFAQLRDAPTLNSTAVPSKLFEYMASGLPIVYGGEGVAAQTVREIGSATVVPPEDPQAVANAVRTLAADTAGRRRMGDRGRAYVEQHAQRATIMKETVRSLRRHLRW